MLDERVSEAIRVLSAINAGDVAVRAEAGWGYSGVYAFAAENGWRFAVFSDCDEFDYFEWLLPPGGERIDYEDAYADPAQGEALDAICAAIDGSAELRALWDCGEWSDEACESAERRRRARG